MAAHKYSMGSKVFFLRFHQESLGVLMTADSVVIQRQEQDMGNIEEGQLESAALVIETSDKMEKGYMDIVEG